LNIRKRFLLLLLLAPLWLNAQNMVFSAEAQPATVGIEDIVHLVYTLENIPDLRNMSNPDIGSFQLVAQPSQSHYSNVSIQGNQAVETVTLVVTYALKPTKMGTFTIPPVTARDGSGKTYQCNPVTIRVVAGSTAPKRNREAQAQGMDPFGGFDPFGDDFFGDDPFAAIQKQQAQMQQLMQQMQQQMQQQAQGMGPKSMANLPSVSEKELGKTVFVRAIVDKTKVLLGEQITVTYKMYTRVPMQAQISKLPSLNGFWTQDFDIPKDQQPQREMLDGVPYSTLTLKKSALFPQQTGKLELDPAEIKGVARLADRSNPWGRDVQFTLRSTPVPIEVLALPAEKQPANFGGAVGQFKLSARIDRNKLSTDDIAVLTLNIEGSGNLKLIEAPVLKLPNGLDAYEPQITDTITGRSLRISGNKIFSYNIAPRVAGEYDIPALEFAYFDPVSKSYTTLHTQPFHLQVSQGKNDKRDAYASDKLPKDIHPMIGSLPTKALTTNPWFFRSAYWILMLCASLLLLAALIWKNRTEKLKSNTALFRKRNANKVALKRLAAAQQFLDQQKTAAFYEEVSKAIWLYLSDKLHIPLSQLSKESAAEELEKRKIAPTLRDRLNRIIDDCELALYAPSLAGKQMKQTYSDAVNLIGELEEILKK
jgi:hypothetical protein